MPKDSRTKRYSRRYRPYKKKTYNKRSKLSSDQLAVKTKVNISRGIFGLPEELSTHLRYVDTYTLTSTTQALAKQVMRLNSIFDPDFTGIGHQPLYTDQFDNFYKRYSVLGAKLKATFSALPSAIATAQPSGPMLCGVTADDDGSTSSTVSTLMETNTTQSTFLCSQNGGNNVKVFYLTYSPKRDLGVAPDDDTVGAAMGANPSKVWFGTAWMAESGLSAASSCNVTIEIDYYVKFSVLANVGGS